MHHHTQIHVYTHTLYWSTLVEGMCEKMSVFKTTRFSFQIALFLLVKQKENLTLHQVSLRALSWCHPFNFWF